MKSKLSEVVAVVGGPLEKGKLYIERGTRGSPDIAAKNIVVVCTSGGSSPEGFCVHSRDGEYVGCQYGMGAAYNWIEFHGTVTLSN